MCALERERERKRETSQLDGRAQTKRNKFSTRGREGPREGRGAREGRVTNRRNLLTCKLLPTVAGRRKRETETFSGEQQHERASKSAHTAHKFAK